METPFWEFLDQLGIVIGLVFAAVEVAQLLYLHHINEEVDEVQEDLEEIQEEVDNGR